MAVETRWRAAFVQGVAVLLGILVAFAIDAAWESRSDRLATAAYLESLDSELEANREEFEAWIEQIDFSIQRNERFLVDLVVDGSETVSQDSVRSMHRTLAPLSVNPPRRAAFDDLVSGGLQTIDDSGLRILIIQYGRDLEGVRAIEQAGADWHLAQFTPYDITFGDLIGMLAQLGLGFAGRTDITFDFDTSAYVGNRQFANLMGQYIARERYILQARQQLLATLVELQEALAEW